MVSRALRLDASTDRKLEWAVAACTYPGEPVSGDLHVVTPFAGGVLLAAVDALGHGTEAEATARLAVATLEQHADEWPPDLLARCHAVLVGSRGAAVSVASIRWDDSTLTWLAIGDVEGRLVSVDRGQRAAPRALMTHGGIVGAGALPGARPSVLHVNDRDMLILATDGIRSTFTVGVNPMANVQQVADGILGDFRKGTDDALVLVARIPSSAEESAP
jgi:phosphoserine phosphatase RsbX